jgi:hypothetical protein
MTCAHTPFPCDFGRRVGQNADEAVGPAGKDRLRVARDGQSVGRGRVQQQRASRRVCGW